jgi:hypothetical protein
MKRLFGEEHPRTIRTLTSYANFLGLAGRAAEGERPAREALSLARENLDADNPGVAYAEATLALLLVELGEGREAEAHARAALESRRRSLPSGHWLIASVQVTLGAALLLEGRVDAAERELSAAHRSLEADRGAQHEKTRLAALWLQRLDEKRRDRYSSNR